MITQETTIQTTTTSQFLDDICGPDADIYFNVGGKTWVAAGDMDLYVEWYGSLGEFARGIERPVFATGGNFSMWETWIKTALFVTADLFMFVVPFFILTILLQ